MVEELHAAIQALLVVVLGCFFLMNSCVVEELHAAISNLLCSGLFHGGIVGCGSWLLLIILIFLVFL